MTARLLFLASPGLMRGRDVRDVQDRLRAHGFPPGPSDGIYGPATEAAVRRFQRKRNLQVDGVVGPITTAALHTDARHGSGSGHAEAGLPGVAALAWMRSHLGMREHPAGSNRCAVTAEFGMVGPWCAMTVSLAFRHGAGLVLGNGPHPSVGYWPGRGFAYCPYLESWTRERGYFIGRGQPVAGDIVLFDWQRDREADHVGLVERVPSDWRGIFTTLEGNTGDVLARRTRTIADVRGFARIPRPADRKGQP